MRRIVADTSVWSLFLRRQNKTENPPVLRLKKAIVSSSVQMLGIIKQEILTGIREEAQFERLKKELSAYPDLLANSDDHLLAAKFYNTCRRSGVQGSHIDFLICAQAFRREMPILSHDGDFENYAEFIPIELEMTQ